MKPNIYLLTVCSCLLVFSCKTEEVPDAVYYNGVVYTVDSAFTVIEAFAVKDGKVVATGTSEQLLQLHAKKQVDLQHRPVYPGFYDAHCHFYGYGVDLKKIWLTGTRSFDEVIDTLVKYRDQRFMGWIWGRGWDQNDWEDKQYPDNARLDSLFPDVPVFLIRIDGHAALANSKALRLCGVNEQTTVQGGELLKKNGRLNGLLIDNAMDLVKLKIPVPDKTALSEALLSAQKNCFAVGLTTVVDAGLDVSTILLIDSLQKAGRLNMRINAMVSFSKANVEYYRKQGPYRSDRLQVQSFKLYADGALGSRGACLLHPYSDLPGHHGFLLSSIDSIRYAARTALDMGFQLNTHCIGDSANRLLLSVYADVLKGKNNKRWRIEHAQVMHPSDFHLFHDFSIIPSVQPTHATSDMYWAGDRLGSVRLKGAYAYRQLLEQAGLLAAGSDFPVEAIPPLYGFYAAVVRKDQQQYPPAGFQPENAISREQALRAMTIWAAYASFQEQERGSIEPGKWADFVVLEKDIMKADESELFSTKVMSTWLAGEQVYAP
ncbi:MAG: amidohydrolase [Bacteroidia bacterium]|nr:amidohydrolase [Bacteroidia bacterium]